jgi:hypothetical protein
VAEQLGEHRGEQRQRDQDADHDGPGDRGLVPHEADAEQLPGGARLRRGDVAGRCWL